jgi:hypothetical protein
MFISKQFLVLIFLIFFKNLYSNAQSKLKVIFGDAFLQDTVKVFYNNQMIYDSILISNVIDLDPTKILEFRIDKKYLNSVRFEINETKFNFIPNLHRNQGLKIYLKRPNYNIDHKAFEICIEVVKIKYYRKYPRVFIDNNPYKRRL